MAMLTTRPIDTVVTVANALVPGCGSAVHELVEIGHLCMELNTNQEKDVCSNGMGEGQNPAG